MSFKQDLQIDWHKLCKAGSEPPAQMLQEAQKAHDKAIAESYEQ
jgi:hypothetical protein